MWKGFDFWKGSYVVHVPWKWHRGEGSLSALQGLAQPWEDCQCLPYLSLPPPEYTPVLPASVFFIYKQFHISLMLTGLP